MRSGRVLFTTTEVPRWGPNAAPPAPGFGRGALRWPILRIVKNLLPRLGHAELKVGPCAKGEKR